MSRIDLEVYCISDKGVRPGTFIPGNKYIIRDWLLPSEKNKSVFVMGELSFNVSQAFIVGDNGVEYDWVVVKDLFITKEEHRDTQLDKLGL